MSDISFWLDNYDDIFSDFDPRSYHKRRLSEDFLDEIRAALRYHKDKPEGLLLLLPKEQRRPEIEPEVINHLTTQFKLRLDLAASKERRIFKRGIGLLLGGILAMSIDALILVKVPPGWGTTMAHILTEPASWFMIWTGLDALVYDRRSATKDTEFFRTIAGLKIRLENI